MAAVHMVFAPDQLVRELFTRCLLLTSMTKDALTAAAECCKDLDLPHLNHTGVLLDVSTRPCNGIKQKPQTSTGSTSLCINTAAQQLQGRPYISTGATRMLGVGVASSRHRTRQAQMLQKCICGYRRKNTTRVATSVVQMAAQYIKKLRSMWSVPLHYKKNAHQQNGSMPPAVNPENKSTTVVEHQRTITCKQAADNTHNMVRTPPKLAPLHLPAMPWHTTDASGP